jgi:DNA modification methylase
MTRLCWVGREEAVRLAGSVSSRKLQKIPKLSSGKEDSGNAVIHADNLQALATLASSLRGRVDLAFLDPPYNAAREAWIYPDRILDWFGSLVGAENEDPLRHDKWLSMMYPRLALLRVLLAESGALFMTLDDHEAHHARILLDEIFGPENFLANVTWEKTQTPEDTGAPFFETHTNVLVYARDATAWRPNPSAGKITTIWNTAESGDTRDTHTAPPSPRAPYPLTPKPVKLLRRILQISAGPDALVLDPFAGSGTTAQAVLEQNASDRGSRRFVLIESGRERARTLVPHRLAEMSTGPPAYDFYTLA